MNPSTDPIAPPGPAFSARSGVITLVIGCTLAGLWLWAFDFRLVDEDGAAVAWVDLVPHVMPALILLVGSGAYFRLTRKEATAYAHRLANADKPWRWRPEWCQPSIASSAGTGSSSLLKAWFVTLFWNGAVWPAMYVIWASDTTDDAKPFILGMLSIFALIGLYLLYETVQSQLRRIKYGIPRFVPKSLPGEIGGQLRGSIELPHRLRLSEGAQVDLALRCVRQVLTGTGKNRQIRETAVWESAQQLPASRVTLGPRGTSLPVAFDIPLGVPESSWSYAGDEGAMMWSLIARAESPGVDLRVSVFVPVFKTVNSLQREAAAEPVEDAEAAPIAQLSPEPVKVSMAAAGPAVRLDVWDYLRVALHNGIPTFGVLILGWSVPLILLLYWLENLLGSLGWNHLIRRHQALTHLRGHYRNQFGVSSGGREIKRFASEHALGTILMTLGHGVFLFAFAFMILDGRALLDDLVWLLVLAGAVAAAVVLELQPLHQGLERRSFGWLREQARVSFWPVISMHLGLIVGGLALASAGGGIGLALVFIGLRVFVDLGRAWYRKNPSVALSSPPTPPDAGEDDALYRAQLQRYQASLQDEEPCPPPQRNRI